MEIEKRSVAAMSSSFPVEQSRTFVLLTIFGRKHDRRKLMCEVRSILLSISLSLQTQINVEHAVQFAKLENLRKCTNHKALLLWLDIH
jgi:hypothetical protein